MKFTKIIPAACIGACLWITACKSDNKTTDGSTVGPTVSTDNTIVRNGDTAGSGSTTSGTNVGTDSSGRAGSTAASGKKSTKKGRGSLGTPIKLSNAKMEMDNTGVYARAEVMPMFPGGEDALRKYIEDNIQYPEQALDNGTEGTVIVKFAVDENGKVYTPVLDPQSDKPGDGLEQEAMRVVNSMPRWTPGRIKGKNVKTTYSLPITYRLY